jgi:GTP-binding protein
VDGRAEITSADRELAQLLRKTGKPVTLAVNKVDTGAKEALVHDFYELGIKDMYPVSAEHGLGMDALMLHITEGFPEGTEEELREDAGGRPSEAAEEKIAAGPIKVAIIGRPNAGKSTLLNALVGEERAIVSPIAGTTRDAVDETVSHGGTDFVFIDTAGIRRKGKTKLMAEKLSVVMARRHIRMANVVVLVMDATEGVLGLDATIAGYAHEGGRPVILCVNKWDLLTDDKQFAFEESIRYHLKFLEYAPVVFLSALKGTGVHKLFGLIKTVFASATRRVTTGELNRFVEKLHFDERKILYITQAGVRPPSFVVFTDKAGPLYFSHERYLVNQLRKRFGFEGTPIELKIRGRVKRSERKPLK